jgi:serine/threonine-protein kinase RsbW
MGDNKTNLKISMNSFDDLELSRDSIVKFCKKYCETSDDLDLIEMSILEACHNAILHGRKKENRNICELKILYDNQSIKVVVKNYGNRFDVAEKNEFSIDQDFLQYKNGGLGIPLIKALMDSVEYERKSNDLNELTIIKKLKIKK